MEINKEEIDKARSVISAIFPAYSIIKEDASLILNVLLLQEIRGMREELAALKKWGSKL